MNVFQAMNVYLSSGVNTQKSDDKQDCIVTPKRPTQMKLCLLLIRHIFCAICIKVGHQKDFFHNKGNVIYFVDFNCLVFKEVETHFVTPKKKYKLSCSIVWLLIGLIAKRLG
jgi:hypothetical protein